MDEYLRFENAIFCTRNCNLSVEIFYSQIFITDFFFFFTFLEVL